MFTFLTNDKPVIKIIRYGIIFIVLVTVKKIFLILSNSKLIQELKIAYATYDRTLIFT